MNTPSAGMVTEAVVVVSRAGLDAPLPPPFMLTRRTRRVSSRSARPSFTMFTGRLMGMGCGKRREAVISAIETRLRNIVGVE